MESERVEKIEKARTQLKAALQLYHKKKGDRQLEFLTVAKAFEILFEYTWKRLKYRIEDEGLFAVSPKEAIRQAATLGLIEDPERWIACATARNDSVHDYFGIPEADYIKLVEEFLELLPGRL